MQTVRIRFNTFCSSSERLYCDILAWVPQNDLVNLYDSSLKVDFPRWDESLR